MTKFIAANEFRSAYLRLNELPPAINQLNRYIITNIKTDNETDNAKGET